MAFKGSGMAIDRYYFHVCIYVILILSGMSGYRSHPYHGVEWSWDTLGVDYQENSLGGFVLHPFTPLF